MSHSGSASRGRVGCGGPHLDGITNALSAAMMRGSPRQAEPTVTDALIEVVDAGHRLVSDRIELAIVEARGIASELAVRVALVMVGALMLTSALVAMDAALVEQMAHWVSRPLALLSCAAVDVLLGGGLILVGVRRREQS